MIEAYLKIHRNVLPVSGTKKEVFSKSLKIASKYGDVIASDELFGIIYLKTMLNLRSLHFPKKIKLSFACIEDQDITIIKFDDVFDVTNMWLMEAFGKEFSKQ